MTGGVLISNPDLTLIYAEIEGFVIFALIISRPITLTRYSFFLVRQETGSVAPAFRYEKGRENEVARVIRLTIQSVYSASNDVVTTLMTDLGYSIP